MREGIVLMDNKLHGFADNGAVITGPETRSSSPVRIIRDKKTMQSNIKVCILAVRVRDMQAVLCPPRLTE